VVLIQVWNQVGTSLDKLDVSKSDTNGRRGHLSIFGGGELSRYGVYIIGSAVCGDAQVA